MLDFALPLIGGHATVNLTPILVSLVLACLPVIGRWAARNVWAEAKPILTRYMDERTMLMFQQRFDRLCDLGISHGVSALSERLTKGGPISVDVKSAIAAAAVEYVSRNAEDTARAAGNVLEKVLARFDLHPAVQAVVNTTPPTEPVTK